MSEVYTDQAIFDAISAAVSRARNFDATSIGIVIDTKAFIETFNNHRDRKLCTSLTPVPMLPCPVCGGEAIHAIDTLKRVVIKPNEPEQDK
jgi:hypothetical protein